LETELFGVEAGAFTDAKVSREGHLLRADGGTLFLDEIGAMPLNLQARLLRFLETRSFRRVGSTREIHVNLRIISATNVDLLAAVAHRVFREDLFYRLQVITLHLPPLRERPEDIEALVAHFLQLYSFEGMEPLSISSEAMELLLRYTWPGNVRELRSAIQRGQILCNDNEIRPEDLPEQMRKVGNIKSQLLSEIEQSVHLPSEGVDLQAFLGKIELKLVREALELCNGNQCVRPLYWVYRATNCVIAWRRSDYTSGQSSMMAFAVPPGRISTPPSGTITSALALSSEVIIFDP
jgi:two-component system NtrC family response regulator